MDKTTTFTKDEGALLADKTFFTAKANISHKIRLHLEQLHQALYQDLQQYPLLSPDNLSLSTHQLVKGEHLENFPYQYLDFPRFYTREEKFSFRSLFWWGHHVVFALIVEGGYLRRYKENLINRYQFVSNRGTCLCLGNSLWEWENGPGVTLELTGDRKPEVSAVLANRPFFKLAKFVTFDDPAIFKGDFIQLGRNAFHAILPVITR